MKNNPKTIYTYHFADGTKVRVRFDSKQDLSCQRHWRAELRKLDQQEYNNQHAESRWCCSLDAQDPMARGGYCEDHSMKNAQLSIELEDALQLLSDDLMHIIHLLDEGLTASDIARLDHVHRSSISRKIKKIRKIMRKAGF